MRALFVRGNLTIFFLAEAAGPNKPFFIFRGMKIDMKLLAEKGQNAKAVGVFSRGEGLLFGETIPEGSELVLKGEGEKVYVAGTRKFIVVKAAFPGLDELDALRLAAFKLHRFLEREGLESLGLYLKNASAAEAEAIFDGLALGGYRFERYKSKKQTRGKLTVFAVAGSKVNDFEELNAKVELEQRYISLAKDLINTSGSDLPPETFAERVRETLVSAGVSIKIRDALKLKKEGFNGLVTVGKGSATPPCMVTISYNPENAKPGVHFGIVGKGITFDTGGISLKPGAKMADMVSDMSGAASALAAIACIAAEKLPIKTTAVLCLAENRIGSGAVLPGDIFKAKNGKTVFVDNTDAEGRLVLSDGLAEAGLAGATHIVDLATLTGAMVRALGYAVSGYFSNDAEFARDIREAGKACGEKFWEMPLEEEYSDGLKHAFADLKNTGSDAGAISAALFLKEFVPEGAVWSHFDIAGTAFVTKAWKYHDFGATGTGIKTLIRLAQKLGG